MAQPLPGSVCRRGNPHLAPLPHLPLTPCTVLPMHATSQGPGCPPHQLPGQAPGPPLSSQCRTVSPGPRVQPHTGSTAAPHAPQLLASSDSIKDEKLHSQLGSQSQPAFFCLFLLLWHPQPWAAASEGPRALHPRGFQLSATAGMGAGSLAGMAQQ